MSFLSNVKQNIFKLGLPMTSKSRGFEQFVARVLNLIGSNDDVTIWDHHIPDPDTGQLRQVDILILQNEKRIFVECRDYKRPQDVTWIESLIGRRDSLGCDLMIGVSSSGFRDTAVEKAKAKGIILRTACDISDAEIASWGQAWEFELDMVCFSAMVLRLEANRHIEKETLEAEISSPRLVQWLAELIYSVSMRLSPQLSAETVKDFSVEVFDRSGSPMFCNYGVKRSVLKSYAVLVRHTIRLPASIEICGDKLELDEQFSGVVFEGRGIAMVRKGEASRLVVSLGGLKIPPGHVWTGSIRTTNRSAIAVSEVKIIGTEYHPVGPPNLVVEVACPVGRNR
ncbi:restriction endonuclease [Jannaschia formosa]|uniref:restriction endonuclease n=1 Tax=Jannaschia formosa TaxID=2259592 RepID=UPI001074CD9E|nr:restriction endonuclease [Jannaschia formosa]TFL16927.1 hypothetical protein DR046_17505 [Jannaschia formosa]